MDAPAVVCLACFVWDRVLKTLVSYKSWLLSSFWENGDMMGVFIKIMVIDTKCLFCVKHWSQQYIGTHTTETEREREGDG